MCIAGSALVAAPAAAKEASGEPIVFGMVNMEDSPLGSFTEYRQGAEAAIEYVNSELNGIHGRPMELDECISKGSPESTTGCANEVLDKKPLAMIGGIDVLNLLSESIYEEAGIPILGGAGLTPVEHKSTARVQFVAWSIGVAALGGYAVDELKAKKVAIIFAEGPATRPVVELFIKPSLGDVEVFEAVGTSDQSDWTSVMSAAVAQNADAIIGVGDANQCLGIIKAHDSLAVAADLLMVAACADTRLLKDLGPAADGIYFEFQNQPASSKNKDVRIFRKKLKRYAPKGTPLTGITQSGFASVMNVWELLNDVPTATLDSSAAVLAAFKATRNQHNFMGHPYSCDGKQAPNAPAVCDAHARIVQVKNGKLVDVEKQWVDAAEFLE